MSKGSEIVQIMFDKLENTTETGEDKQTIVETAHVILLEVHSRALSAHCECLGMNAKNCHYASVGRRPPYDDKDYLNTMQKWGIVDKEGKPSV